MFSICSKKPKGANERQSKLNGHICSNRFCKSSGLTLVELLAVIAVVAVLVSVALTTVRGAIRASQEKSVNRQVQTFNSAYQTFIASGGQLTSLVSNNQADNIAFAKPAVTALETALVTPAGTIGPFLPESPDEWYLPGDTVGRVIGMDTFYIGFDANSGYFVIEP